MANFSEALKDLINSFAGVTTLIGALPTMRFYPVRLPTIQTPVYPAVTWQRVDGEGVYSHGGYSGLNNPRIQITVWAKTFTAAESVEIAMRAQPPLGLNGYVGTIDGVKFDRIFFVDGITDFEETTQVHQRTFDLMIGYVG